MIFDTDDLFDGNDRLDLLDRLKEANPAFKLTAFAVPRLASDSYWESLPDWIELAVHGEYHPHPREAENWTYEKTVQVLMGRHPRFVAGWKAPGWQISDATYQACLDLGFWVADQPYNDHRRPQGLRVHRLGDGDHVHTHVQNVEGNGLAETFTALLKRVQAAGSFQFMSEVVQPWHAMVAA